MSTISVTWPSDGDTIDASDISTPGNTIVNAINGNLDSTNVSAGGLTPASLTSGTGSSWAWQSYTPTFANTTLGSGSVSGKYIQIGKTVFFRAKFTLGSGSAVGTGATVSLPVTSVAYGTSEPMIAQCMMVDTGTETYNGQASYSSTTTWLPTITVTNSTYGGARGTTSTQPHTWASGDILYVAGCYEAA